MNEDAVTSMKKTVGDTEKFLLTVGLQQEWALIEPLLIYPSYLWANQHYRRWDLMVLSIWWWYYVN